MGLFDKFKNMFKKDSEEEKKEIEALLKEFK